MTGERGAAPSLVCVPGLGLDERAWQPTTRRLDSEHADDRSLVVALPGYGRRPTDDGDLGPEALGAHLVATWLSSLSTPVVLAGHSASCQIVAHAAALAPSRVSGLVLVGPTTDPRAASWPRIGQRWLRTALWEPPAQWPLLARTYGRTGPRWMARAMDAARRADVREAVRDVECPVLVVRGPHDRICPEDWTHDLAALAPAGSRALTLASGAHMVPLTRGRLLAAALGDFLDR